MANLSLTGFFKDNAGIFYKKDPSANITLALDFADYLVSGDSLLDDSTGEPTVTLGTISGDASPLAFPTSHATDVQVSGTKVVFRVNGGTSGNIYPIQVQIVTANGDTDKRHFRIVVENKELI